MSKSNKVIKIILGSGLLVLGLTGFVVGIAMFMYAEVRWQLILAFALIQIFIMSRGASELAKGLKKNRISNTATDKEEDVELDESVVKCNNKLCGMVISRKFEKCPFCGTPISQKEKETKEED